MEEANVADLLTSWCGMNKYNISLWVIISDDESQGKCLAEEHSLHITISSYQLNSWTDLLEKLLPAALAVAAQDDPEFREVGWNWCS